MLNKIQKREISDARNVKAAESGIGGPLIEAEAQTGVEGKVPRYSSN